MTRDAYVGLIEDGLAIDSGWFDEGRQTALTTPGFCYRGGLGNLVKGCKTPAGRGGDVGGCAALGEAEMSPFSCRLAVR